MTSFRDLIVWQEAHKLVVKVYSQTKFFPKTELYGLTNQMRRCSVSISSNIAEGFSRRSYKEKIQFYSISAGSITELQNQLLIAKDVGYLNAEDLNSLFDQTIDVHKLLNAIIKKSSLILNSKF
ncbi:MAG: four helix bundle protein [Candidatus Komeilibacteria bacterium]|nr:four helix bundle protein [Candidatus Komeilibacteria bacterium]